MGTLLANSDTVVEVQTLTDAVADTVITTATVTVTLKDSDGNNITDAVDLPLSHISGGTYRGNIPDTVSLTANTTVTGTFVADDGILKHWEQCEEFIVICGA